MVHAAQVESRETKEALRQARVDLSMALRMAVRLGLNEGIDNHFTLMVPGRNDLFLLSPYGLHWSEVTPDALMSVNAKGTRVASEDAADHGLECLHRQSGISYVE